MQRPSVSLSYPAFMALSPDDASSPSEDHFSPTPALEAGMNPRMDMGGSPLGILQQLQGKKHLFFRGFARLMELLVAILFST